MGVYLFLLLAIWRVVQGHHSKYTWINFIFMTVKNCILFCGFLLSTIRIMAQDDAAELAKKLANPVASLISVPFQENMDHGIGSLKGSRSTLNIQPVVPISISPKLNLIARWVQPVITQYNITGLGERQFGLADAVVSAFISPRDSKKGFTWGAGPAFLLPIGTNEFLTTKK
jgi:hypothetical protein